MCVSGRHLSPANISSPMTYCHFACVSGKRVSGEGEENAGKWKITLMACVRRRERKKALGGGKEQRGREKVKRNMTATSQYVFVWQVRVSMARGDGEKTFLYPSKVSCSAGFLIPKTTET